MSDHIERYRRRVSRNGNDVGEAYKNNTIAFIEATFHSSPTFRRMKVNSYQFPEIKEIDARVVEVERMGSLREAVLRPSQYLDVGAYVHFDDEDYIVFDRHGGTGATNNKLTLARCNRHLKWYDQEGNLQDMLCVASATDLGSKSKQSKNELEWNKYDVRLPVGQLFVFVEINEATKKIDLNDRFIFGRNAYEVTGIDDITAINQDGYGIIQLTIKITTKTAKDDFENGIAFNEYKTDVPNEETEVGIMSDNTNETDNKGSGRLW
ncbi:hypothetical protein PQE75_gp227 [Bacillus phage vB_BcoS-136]|uniref:Uncharacterized protein n=1 Tax=Bacillus phage vB_BcoS-136 TaxID=2419619 RepID=A0A3G3BVG2_9CAUD|nr:hypothetical protein PQE75_gp227 [Bacillus phage vB_BcoS-136]AYP68252.1 hypothetical protein vBBcoS136_00137 [Bacillus phage vB_BcoS-136]